MTVETIGTVRRWSMLAIALTTTLFANVFINGAAFLIPTLHIERGLDLAKAGLLSSMPSFGMVFTLIAWGYVVDRIGERIVLAVGSALTAAAAFAAASVHSLVAVGAFLLLGGMAAASSNTRQRPVGGGLVPAATARPGHGYPADGPAAGSRVGRLGDSAAGGELRRFGRTAVSRRGVRTFGRGVRVRREGSATAAARGGHRA